MNIQHQHHEGVDFLKAFEDSSIDFIFMNIPSMILESQKIKIHDKHLFLREAIRCLKPSGVICGVLNEDWAALLKEQFNESNAIWRNPNNCPLRCRRSNSSLYQKLRCYQKCSNEEKSIDSNLLKIFLTANE